MSQTKTRKCLKQKPENVSNKNQKGVRPDLWMSRVIDEDLDPLDR